VARLTQGPEELTGVIRCTACGLTLEWETEIKVSVSRTGRRIREQQGPDPIEAWNRRQGPNCESCGVRNYAENINMLHNCNDCGQRNDCEHLPEPGQMARINCPLWRHEEE
jgi:predicted RNA-binding Zn-ribbon protein involved in translation (DUF1610 family)